MVSPQSFSLEETLAGLDGREQNYLSKILALHSAKIGRQSVENFAQRHKLVLALPEQAEVSRKKVKKSLKSYHIQKTGLTDDT